MKRRQNTLATQDHNNSVVWQINNSDKYMTKMDSNTEEVLSIFFDI